jgi:ribosomal protein L11 methyltransferase
MQWIQAHVAIFADNPQVAVDLVANIFFDLEVKGVMVDDPDLTPMHGLAKDAVKPPKQFGVTGYFADTPLAIGRCKQLEIKIDALKKCNGGNYGITYMRLDEADWAESWKEFFWPQRITSNLVVKPTWRNYRAEENEIVIEIDPGMAFGTGTHPTTALCLTMIEKYIKPKDRFLDIGTGSGILMIAAARLGAGIVHGIDNDETAVEVALKNLMQNKIDPRRYKVAYGVLTQAVSECYDLVVANILSETILLLLDGILRFVTPEGLFVCSGITEKNREKVLLKIRSIGLEIVEIAGKDEWVAVVARSK